jgi:hypothetical protein
VSNSSFLSPSTNSLSPASSLIPSHSYSGASQTAHSRSPSLASLPSVPHPLSKNPLGPWRVRISLAPSPSSSQLLPHVTLVRAEAYSSSLPPSSSAPPPCSDADATRVLQQCLCVPLLMRYLCTRAKEER